MQEMKNAIEKAEEQFCGERTKMDGPPGELLEAAQKWSQASLETFSGELLRKAMLLAASMAEFAHEMQNPS
jgi:hypothetical protein